MSAGRITIDGQDVRSVTLETLRAAVGVIQQDVFLFDDTMSRNIGYADPDAADEALREAARVAQLQDFVRTLPDGYATMAGERGASLSGGQRQRVSIARGILPAPRVLILDDVTSAVDAATEQALRTELREAALASATIIISHRLASVTHADEIIVLDAGRVMERGTHAGLLAAGGYYAALWALQSHAGYDEAPPFEEDVAPRRQVNA